MTLALIIVGILVAPVLIAPIAISLGRAVRERKLLNGLVRSGASAYRGGRIIFRPQFDFLGPCDRETVVCGSPRVCEGPMLDIDERYVTTYKEDGKEQVQGEVDVGIGSLCLRCGHLEWSFLVSRLIGPSHVFIRSSAGLKSFLEERARLIMMGVPI